MGGRVRIISPSCPLGRSIDSLGGCTACSGNGIPCPANRAGQQSFAEFAHAVCGRSSCSLYVRHCEPTRAAKSRLESDLAKQSIPDGRSHGRWLGNRSGYGSKEIGLNHIYHLISSPQYCTRNRDSSLTYGPLGLRGCCHRLFSQRSIFSPGGCCFL